MTLDLKRLRDELKRDEGVKRFPYDDKTGEMVKAPAGHITIGAGRNLHGRPLSDAVIDLMLEEDIEEAIKGARRVFGDQFESFSSRRKHAIVNMIFNLGVGKFNEFHSTIAAMIQGEWSRAAFYASQSLWFDQVGPRAHRIVRDIANG